MKQVVGILTKMGIFIGGCVFTLLLFEGVMRVTAFRKNIYTIEMVKYAKQLKMDGTTRGISHVHRPNTAAKLMGVEIELNSMGHRGPDLSGRCIPG